MRPTPLVVERSSGPFHVTQMFGGLRLMMRIKYRRSCVTHDKPSRSRNQNMPWGLTLHRSLKLCRTLLVPRESPIVGTFDKT